MITEKIRAHIAHRGYPLAAQPVNTEFAYDEVGDPLVIMVRFTGDDIVEDGEQVWAFARELIIRGSQATDEPYGEGDVRFQQVNGGVIMSLNNATGHADVWLSKPELEAFLEKTTELVPVGQENIESAIDLALKELLG